MVDDLRTMVEGADFAALKARQERDRADAALERAMAMWPGKRKTKKAE